MNWLRKILDILVYIFCSVADCDAFVERSKARAEGWVCERVGKAKIARWVCPKHRRH